MKLYIRNMATSRCIGIVAAILKTNEVAVVSVKLGEVETVGKLPLVKLQQLQKDLQDSGFELLEGNDVIIVQQIKAIAIDLVRNGAEAPLHNFSGYLSERLGLNYTYMANLFSRLEGRSITGFIIAHKIEMVKELLQYRQHTLTEIAEVMHYSSVAHLSGQFKKVMGVTPTAFLNRQYDRLPLEDL